MKAKIKKYEEVSPVDFLILRDNLGFNRYRKTAQRNEEEKRILLELGLKKIEEKDRNDFIFVGYKRRKLKI
jgi:hypothetical protein